MLHYIRYTEFFIRYFVNPASSHPSAAFILIMPSNSCILYINVHKLIHILTWTLNYLKHHHYAAVIFIISTMILDLYAGHCEVNPIVRSHSSKSHQRGCPSLTGGGESNEEIETEGVKEKLRQGVGRKKVTAIWDDSTSMSGIAECTTCISNCHTP